MRRFYVRIAAAGIFTAAWLAGPVVLTHHPTTPTSTSIRTATTRQDRQGSTGAGRGETTAALVNTQVLANVSTITTAPPLPRLPSFAALWGRGQGGRRATGRTGASSGAR